MPTLRPSLYAIFRHLACRQHDRAGTPKQGGVAHLSLPRTKRAGLVSISLPRPAKNPDVSWPLHADKCLFHETLGAA